MRYIDSFWQEERDIPPDSGFDLFGIEHIWAMVNIVAYGVCKGVCRRK